MESLVFDFLNSKWHNRQAIINDNERKQEIRKVFEYYGFVIKEELTDSIINQFLSVRTWIFTLIKKVVQNRILSNGEIEQINKYLLAGNFNRELRIDNYKYNVNQVSIIMDWKNAVIEIISSLADVLTESDTTRIRICENPDCQWIFFDSSRSRTKRHCDSNCQNLMKVRRFRNNKTVKRTLHRK